MVMLLAQCLVACGGGGGEARGNDGGGSGGGVVDAANPLHGRYVGTIQIGGEAYFADALFTADGSSRMYIGGPYANTGSIQMTATPWGSLAFEGSITGQGGQASGAGMIIGRKSENCGTPGSPSAQYCGRAVSAKVHIEQVAQNGLDGIRGALEVDGKTWELDLTAWSNTYTAPARLENLAGTYVEKQAEFATGDDTIINVDGAGRLFFQESTHFCTGNGTLAPHGDASYNVFDVTLTIENCDYPYDGLNGEYRGLATTSTSGYWDYDSNLRIWTSRSSPAFAAVTMWGQS
jgi:hypothetical protein